MTFSVGDRVHSRRVGARAAFEGEVIKVRDPIKDYPASYDVRDADGQAWNRSAAELALIEACAGAAA